MVNMVMHKPDSWVLLQWNEQARSKQFDNRDWFGALGLTKRWVKPQSHTKRVWSYWSWGVSKQKLAWTRWTYHWNYFVLTILKKQCGSLQDVPSPVCDWTIPNTTHESNRNMSLWYALIWVLYDFILWFMLFFMLWSSHAMGIHPSWDWLVPSPKDWFF